MFTTPQNAKLSSKQKEMDALKAKNAPLCEREVALNEREKKLREKLEGVGQLLIDGNNKLKSSVKTSDRAAISEAEVMIETATVLSQKLDTELSELRAKREAKSLCLRTRTLTTWPLITMGLTNRTPIPGVLEPGLLQPRVLQPGVVFQRRI